MLRKALALTASAANSVIAFDTRVEDTLLVWAGDQAREASDFVAVIDFDREPPRYRKVLRTVPLPPLLRNATISDEFDALSTGASARPLWGARRRSSRPRRRMSPMTTRSDVQAPSRVRNEFLRQCDPVHARVPRSRPMVFPSP
jgi:hypothetical protein